MTTVVHAGQKVGRNDSCPCGSGRKHKKCCGNPLRDGQSIGPTPPEPLQPPQRFDADQCRTFLELLHDPGAAFEIRILKTARAGTVSGCYDNIDAVVRDAGKWSGNAPAVYVTLNPILPALLARSANHLTERVQQTTSDREVLKRGWLLVDGDPCRPTGISSTDDEHAAALELVCQIRHCLSTMGWPEPILADSGNGGHLLYRIDLPNDADSLALVEGCLKALAFRFDSEAVKVDTGNGNAARICKLYGTLACKGDSTTDRPHRLACILENPPVCEPVPAALLHALAAQVPTVPQTARPSGRTPQPGREFDLEQWIEEHGLPVVRSGPWQGGKRWILDPCPNNPEHTGGCAYIVQLPSGGIAAGCHHDSCQDFDWHALRRLVDPSWGPYEEREGRPQRIAASVVRHESAEGEEEEPALPVEEKVEPFPLKALAAPFRALVEEGAAAIQCPSDFIAVPLLTAAGAAAGATCCLVLKGGWEEGAALYSAPVAVPGTAKTAAYHLATQSVYDQAAKLRQQWEAECAQWEKRQADHKPQPPRMKRVVISDATVEAVGELLGENPRGLLQGREELSGWAEALNAYRAGKGGDRQFYQSAWSGAPCSVDRKKQEHPIVLDHPFLAITGFLQPDTVRTLLHEDRRDDGFLDRILFSYPDASPPRQWSEATVRPDTLKEVSAVFSRLYGLSMGPDGPVKVKMSKEAKLLWVEWYEGHQAELVEVEESLRGAWAKMPIQAARLILISHLTRWAVGETAALETEADRVSVAYGTALAEYFKSHARRVWGVLGEREGERTVRRLVDWLRRKGSPGIRPRDVLNAKVPGIHTPEEAKRVLDTLTKMGKGEWRPPPPGLSGQQQAERFFLISTRHSTP